jgi:hypothetical protein
MESNHDNAILWLGTVFRLIPTVQAMRFYLNLRKNKRGFYLREPNCPNDLIKIESLFQNRHCITHVLLSQTSAKVLDIGFIYLLKQYQPTFIPAGHSSTCRLVFTLTLYFAEGVNPGLIRVLKHPIGQVPPSGPFQVLHHVPPLGPFLLDRIHFSTLLFQLPRFIIPSKN